MHASDHEDFIIISNKSIICKSAVLHLEEPEESSTRYLIQRCMYCAWICLDHLDLTKFWHFQSLIYISSFIISYWCVCLKNTAYKTIIPMFWCYMAGVLLCLCLQVRQLVFKMVLKTQSNTEFRYAAQTE